MRRNPPTVLLPWQAHTMTLSSMRALLALYRKQMLDGRAVRPLVVRGLASWNKSKPSLTDRGYEFAKALSTLIELEATHCV